MKFILKDISLYFKSNCCNETKPKHGMVSTLGETMPQKWHLRMYEHFWKHKHLPLHEICITFTPKWRKQNNLVLHTKLKEFIQRFMAKHQSKRPWYIFYPEFSPKGYLHYHGIIYFDNANDYWMSEIKCAIRNKFGNTEGKQIYNFSKYWAYMTKDKEKDLNNIKPYSNISFDITTAERHD